MNIVGWIFLVLVIVLVLTAAAVVVRSIPDIRRYGRIRKM